MVALLLRDRTDAIRELERGREVGKFIDPQLVSGGVQRPTGAELHEQLIDPRTRQRRHSASARHALLICQSHQRMMPAAGPPFQA
jgi:hypothetical protein